MTIQNRLHALFSETRDEFTELLSRSVQISSISGQEKEFVLFLREWAEHRGFETDLFPVPSGVSSSKDIFLWPPAHLPLEDRPVLVITLRGNGGKSVIFNAHADTVSEGDKDAWTTPPFSGKFENGRVYGRGACDTKGPLVSALWAMYLIKKLHPEGPVGDIHLEVIPGEEDCVGIGTLASLTHGCRADAAVILEPTESLPRCASRGGLRFAVEAKGRAIHGTVRWLGRDAIISMRKVLSAIDELQDEWNDRTADALFAPYPIARPIAVDKISGGKWQGMVCDRCRCEGYLETLPADDLDETRKRFIAELSAKLPGEELEFIFTENYQGHTTSPDSPLCRAAEAAVREHDGTKQAWKGWSAFNSGCESGVRARVGGTPTIIWGPGSVEHAHSPDEYVDFSSVERCAELFIGTVAEFQNSKQKD